MISLGANSDSLIMKAETDFGPRVSLELNSLLPSSLGTLARKLKVSDQSVVLQNLIGKLRIIVLLRQNVEELSHGL